MWDMFIYSLIMLLSLVCCCMSQALQFYKMQRHVGEICKEKT